MQAINPTSTTAWSKLVDLAQNYQHLTITELFDQKDRFEKYSLEFEDLLVDFSKNRLPDDVFEALLQLAQEAALPKAIESMFVGQSIKQKIVLCCIQPYETVPTPRFWWMGRM